MSTLYYQKDTRANVCCVKIESNRVVYHRQNSCERFQGSSLLKTLADKMYYRAEIVRKKIQPPLLEAVRERPPLTPKMSKLLTSLSLSPEKEYPKIRPLWKPRSYKINKQKVRGKAFAFFNLRQSKKFCAFYSISFPPGITQQQAVKALNIWLTRAHKHGLKSFLRVAEFQKHTGTIHFHLLTNNFLNIRTMNYYMAVTLDNMGLFDPEFTIATKDTYNGVDVKHVRNSKHLGSYLTKYVSKNNEVFSIYPYHSSRDVSALFTCVNTWAGVGKEVLEEAYVLLRKFLSHGSNIVIDVPYAVVEYYGKSQANGKIMHPPRKLFERMFDLNDQIADAVNKGTPFYKSDMVPYDDVQKLKNGL